MVIVGLVVVLASLIFITKNMKTLIAERVERSMNAILGRGGGFVAIIIGLLITIAVQSSSITTSILIPMSAAGVIKLRNAYPVTLGANVGTTITALLAALGSEPSRGAHRRAGAHGVQRVRHPDPVRDPDHAAGADHRSPRSWPSIAVKRRMIAVAYVVGTFIVVPLVGVAIFR